MEALLRTPSYSRGVARSSGSNFYYSFFFLPPRLRKAVLVVYAFSRLVDDAVDEAGDEETARNEIALWRRRLAFCYGETLREKEDHPILLELKETIQTHSIPESYFTDLLDGMEMDLRKKRYETWPELEDYCYHVAGTIGLLCNHLFGIPDEMARRSAVLLGKALQLTNILRDVGGDADKGRIYLPQEDLRRFGVEEEGILSKKPSESFLSLMRFEAARARDLFESSDAALPSSARRRVIPARVMRAYYRRILDKLARENFPVFEKKISLGRREKIELAVRALAVSWL